MTTVPARSTADQPPARPAGETGETGETGAADATLTHFDAGGQAHMVDVGNKQVTHRIAVARGTIRMRADTLAVIGSGSAKKGDVIGIARIAAIQGAKRTADLIPLCHPIALTRVTADFELDERLPAVHCTVQVECTGRTGVEMEALTAVQVGLLTIYDMCKAIDRAMTIDDVGLLEKRGGKSGVWMRAEPVSAPAPAADPARGSG